MKNSGLVRSITMQSNSRRLEIHPLSTRQRRDYLSFKPSDNDRIKCVDGGYNPSMSVISIFSTLGPLSGEPPLVGFSNSSEVKNPSVISKAMMYPIVLNFFKF
jgi:hypothetical protein